MRKTLTKSFLASLSGLLVIASAALSLTALSLSASAKIDNTPDYDNVAVIRGGVSSTSDAKAKCEANKTGDLDNIYKAFGFDCSDISGMKSGVVYQNGDVKVGGTVVATDAMTAGRNYGGTPISGSKNAGKYSVSKFVDDGQTALVKLDSNGKFLFAIVKPCGNPVSAKPKTTPKPKPQPKPTPVVITKVKVCNPATGQTITVDEDEANNYKPVGDIACSNITVCRLSDKKVVVIRHSDFDASKYSKDTTDCQEQPAVIPHTGPSDLIVGGLGISSLTAAGYYFRASRRTLVDKFLNR